MNISHETVVFIGKMTEMSEFEYTSTTGIPSSEGESIYLLPEKEEMTTGK